MKVIRFFQTESRKVRVTIELILLVMGVLYYTSIIIMHIVSPLTDMLPLLLFGFTIPLVLSLVLIHQARRLNIFMVLACVSLTGFPFCIVMHNFLEGLARRTVDIVFLHQALNVLHGVFFFGALFVCPPGFLIGIIGALFCLIHSNNSPEKTI